jgi:hypothetical protein
MNKRLFILVEGGDDVRFFGRIVKPLFMSRYESVEIIPYASIKREKVNRFLQSVRLMNNDYIFISDIDFEHSVRDKKQILFYHYNNIEGGNIVVVVMEIESWYLAGLPAGPSQKLGVPYNGKTDGITKEDFNRIIPAGFESRIDFMFEILKFFSIEHAAENNRYFRYFIHRFHLGGGGTRDIPTP